MTLINICDACGSQLPDVEPGPGICPHCGAEFEFNPSKMRRVHWGRWQDVLRGRGRLEKESLSLEIFEAMVSSYQSWTDPQFGDNPEPAELRERLIQNAREETEAAVAEFVAKFGDGEIRSNQPGG